MVRPVDVKIEMPFLVLEFTEEDCIQLDKMLEFDLSIPTLMYPKCGAETKIFRDVQEFMWKFRSCVQRRFTGND